MKKSHEYTSIPHTSNLKERLFKSLLKDRIILTAIIILLSFYLSLPFSSFLAPYSENWSDRNFANATPTAIYIIDGDTGQLTWPYVFGYKKAFNPETFEINFTPVLTEKYPVKLFVQGEAYKLFGFIPGNLHLFGVTSPGKISLLGNDINGRDVYSRLFFGAQISLTIGFLSALIVYPIGLIYGGISGFFGGWVDNLMMRFAEVMMSIPSLYLLVGLASIMPAGLTSSQRFTGVILVVSFVSWASLSRIIRGMVLSIKQQEFVENSRSIGLGDLPIIIRHILPQTSSYVITSLTLSVPGYILSESSLSFLGLGIQQPDASWGNMLKDVQNIYNLINRPEMMAPGILIFLAVLAFNIIGDAVRDVMDPKAYARR